MLGALIRLLVANLLGNLVRALRNLPRALRRRPPWVRLRLEEPLAARPSRPGPFRRRAPSLASLSKLCEELADDPHVEGVVVELHTLSGGWAQARELSGILARLGRTKETIAHLSTPSLREYVVACAARRIVVDESGPLGLHGLAAEALFFGRAVERAGGRAEAEFRGEYKSMGEMFTRDDMSPAHREALDAVLDGILADVALQVAAARGVSQERAAQLVEAGPYLPADALAAGLVDEVAYADTVVPDAASPRAWARARWLPLTWKPLFARRRKVAVVALHGPIVGGEGSGRRSFGAVAAARALGAVREDRRCAAVVLHIDCRGGSAPASDLVWHAVKRVAERKPVVAYLHDVAASGGYYVACAAQKIVASPTTLTGSIGVVAGKVSLAGLYEKLGVTSVVLARGSAATMGLVSRGYSFEERRRLAAEVNALYAQFVAKVAAGRGLGVNVAERHARGRVWLGAAAHERGLVDALGGVDDAVALAAELAGEALDPVERRGYPAPPVAARAAVGRRAAPRTRARGARRARGVDRARPGTTAARRAAGRGRLAILHGDHQLLGGVGLRERHHLHVHQPVRPRRRQHLGLGDRLAALGPDDPHRAARRDGRAHLGELVERRAALRRQEHHVGARG